MAAEENQHILLNNRPHFEWRPGKPIPDSEQINNDNTVDKKQVIQGINELDQLYNGNEEINDPDKLDINENK